MRGASREKERAKLGGACTVEEFACLAGVQAAPMGNKATVQLDLPNGEASARMSGNEEGCPAALSTSAAAAAGADASDEERAYASPGDEEEGVEGEGVVAASTTEERAEDAINFTRNNSQSSMGNKLPAAGGGEVAAGAEAPTPDQVDDAATANEGVAGVSESVLPPPPLAPPSGASASPPRAPGLGGNDLQLPPLNDPHPLPGSEEAGRLTAPPARGSPNNSADGRDQKGAQ